MKKLFLLLSVLFLLTVAPAYAQQQSDTKPLVITVGPAHQAVLTWTATVSSPISGYHAWRSTTSGSGYVQIGTIASGTLTFTDTHTLRGSTTYYYVVTSFSPACPTSPTCGESANSNQVTAVIPSP